MIIRMKLPVALVEERFQTYIKDEAAYGSTQSESKALEATERVSTGWWLSLKGWHIAFSVGPEKPDFYKDDLVEVEVRINKVSK